MDQTRKRPQPVKSKYFAKYPFTGGNMAKHDDEWFNRYWRPAMGWQYLVVCLFDFMFAPMFMSWFSFFTKTPLVPWVPLTLQGGGLYHLSMGTVVGITSYAKSQERTALINSPYAPAPGQVAKSTAPDPER